MPDHANIYIIMDPESQSAGPLLVDVRAYEYSMSKAR